jgi:LPXTG-motif cell wall-anchored protein
LKKIDADSRSSLSGAKFTLYKASLSDGLIKKGDKFGEEITSEPNGLATFADLDYNTTYLLVETQAPNGYKTNGPWAVQIDSNGKTTLTKVNAVESNENSFRVTNDTISKELGYTDPFEVSDKKIEYTLPSTGGNGTKALYMIGTLLSILGVIYVVLKKGKGGFFSEKKNL